jgi:hypothetical protein
MKPVVKIVLLLFLSPLLPLSGKAQCTNGTNACAQAVPHLVTFRGALRNVSGAQRSGVVAIKFVIYGDSTGGTPLWQEVQNTQVDQQGHYEVMLGATGSEGIPMELFTSGEPRWLEVQALLPGEEEQPRVLLVSVPYALKAGDANTLGGLPASAFARVAPSLPNQQLPLAVNAPELPGGQTVASLASVSATGSNVTFPGSTTGTVPKFSSGGSLVNSQITDNNGTVSVPDLSNILFADRFSGGVPAAIAACPTNGCIIYAVSPKVNLNLGNIDPGFRAITIYLGPFTYTVKQITLRKGLKIIGMGASGGVNGSVTCSTAAPCNGTALQSINGNNPVFVVPQANNSPATDVLLSGFRLLGSVGNTSEDGFLLDTSSSVNSGLWFSTFDDVTMLGFAGIGIHIKGRNNDFTSATQWILFNNVTVIRNPGGGNAVRMEGAVFELRFRNCQFNGQAKGDGTNIYIGGLAAASGDRGFPFSLVFEGLVSQSAATAVQIDGGVNLTFYGSHHEELSGGYQITNNTNLPTRGLTISDSYFASNVGTNGGSGFDLNITTTLASGIFFVHNRVFGNPDSVVKGTNIASVVYQDNFSSETSDGPPTSGITTQVSPATSINVRGVHSIGLNPSTTPITTIQSGLGPGETITFFTLGGAVTFGTGGNIDLMGMNSLTVNGSITFVRSDLGGLFWKPVSQWSPNAAGPTAQSQKVVGVRRQPRSTERAAFAESRPGSASEK